MSQKETGQWVAKSGKAIKPDEEMLGILGLAEAGYGQVALKGKTPDGHVAQIKTAILIWKRTWQLCS
jgi:hypothetical protein